MTETFGRRARLASFAIALATLAVPAWPQGYGPPFYRAATLEELARPRAKAVAHVVRVKFPATRRDTGPETRNAVRAWAEGRGLLPGLDRFVTHEYELAPGMWVPFLEWRDYREGFRPGEEVRVYLQDIAPDRAKPLMLALFAYHGWSRELTQLDEQIMANLGVMGGPYLEKEFQPVASERLGLSRAALEEELAFLMVRSFLHRHPSDDRLHPGPALTVSVQGSFAKGRATNGDALSFAGYARMESLAEERMRSLGDCLIGQVRMRGAPANLAIAARECGNADLAADIADGYRISYFPGAADANGRIPIYSICAEPVLPWATGLTTYAAQENDAYVSRLLAVPPFIRSSSCAAASYRFQDGFPVIKHCLAAFAARNPSRGYPPDLAPIGPAGDRCLEAIARDHKDWFSPRFILAKYDRSYEYRPGKPGADGRVTVFEVRTETLVNGQLVEVMLTERGELHAAERRTPTRADPTPDVLGPRIVARLDAREARWKAAGELCRQGSIPDCSEYAHFLWIEGPRDDSYPLWDRACEAGHDESCLFSPKYIQASFKRLREACDRRDALACEGERNTRAEIGMNTVHKRNCERGDAKACARLAEMARQFRQLGRLEPPR